MGSKSCMPSNDLQRLRATKVCPAAKAPPERSMMKSLALVDGDGPGQPQGILRERAELLFLYFLFLLIISIAHVFPHHAPHVVFLSALRLHPDEFLSEVHHLSQRSIHPPAVGIIIEQHHLCAALELQFLQGGQAGLGKLTLDLALEAYDVVVDAAQVLVVDKVHLVAPCCQCDAEAAFLRYGSLAEVEQLQVGGRGRPCGAQC